MLTLFTTAKRFVGHFDMIQRSALKSWTLLHPDVEVILFGDEAGAAEVCRDLGLRHEPEVKRGRTGAVRADYMFQRAQEISRHNILCYSNCDIVLMSDFRISLERAAQWSRQFLMVGRRWDTDIRDPIDFGPVDWESALMRRARKEGVQNSFEYIDYFAFSRGLYSSMPALVVGRIWWDHWMLWSALQRVAVIDASESVCAVHQNHDYSHHPEGKKGVYEDEDALRNFQLAGGRRRMRTIEDAPFLLSRAGIRRNRFHWLAPSKRRWRRYFRASHEFSMRYARKFFWHPILNATRPVRHAIGLKKKDAIAR